MNGGIHDTINLAGRLARGVAQQGTYEFDRFDKQRRLVTLEYIQNYTIQTRQKESGIFR
jgi:3-(3-hydroxy-phenyl)propionate hydroxylase